MKKRIFALLTAMIMVFSVFVFSACTDENEDSSAESSASESETSSTSDETSESDAVELSAKDLFVLSFKNTFGSDTESEGESAAPETEGESDSAVAVPDVTVPDFSMMQKDYISNFSVVINELSMEDVDFVSGTPIQIDGTIKGDADKGVALDMEFNAFGETVPVGAIMDHSYNFVITDFFGVNDKYLSVPTEDLGLAELQDQMNVAISETEKMTEVLELIIDATSSAIDANISDDLYAAETKDVTIDGVEYKDATVLTLTITSELFETILTDIWETLIANDTFKEVVGEDAIKDFFPEDSENGAEEIMTISNTVIDGEIIAIDFFMGDTSKEAEDVKANVIFTENGLKAKLESAEEKVTKMELVYSYNEADGKISLNFSATEAENTVMALVIEGTYTEENFDGSISVTAEGTTISIDILSETSENGYKVTIDNLSMGMFTIPFEMTMGYAYTDKSSEFTLDLAMNLMDYMVIDIEISGNMQETAFELPEITEENCVNINDVDDVTGQRWLSEIMTKYPKTIAYVQQLSQMMESNTPDVPEYGDDIITDSECDHGPDIDFSEAA